MTARVVFTAGFSRRYLHHPYFRSSKTAFWVMGAFRIDVEIDDFDAALRLLVAGAAYQGPSRSRTLLTFDSRRQRHSTPGGKPDLLWPVN